MHHGHVIRTCFVCGTCTDVGRPGMRAIGILGGHHVVRAMIGGFRRGQGIAGSQ